MAIIPPCDFTLIKRNELGKAFGNVYLLSIGGSQQTVNSGFAVRFNNYDKLSGIAWLTQDTITIIKNATYKIDFTLNYVNQPNIEVAIFVNGNAMIGSFGLSTPLIFGTSQLSGTYVLKLNKNDKVRLVNIGNTFVLKSSSLDDEIIATMVISEQ